jgi:23S rRNA pseudouridine2605 synthase
MTDGGRGMNSLPHALPRRLRWPGTGLARALSKLGFCSRRQAEQIIKEGRIRVNGVIRLDPEFRVELDRARIEADGQAVHAEIKVYLMLNKPRGLVTTASDERGRRTVFECLADTHLPFVSPVGRLDQASEGLLLLTNDTQWAARITAPDSHLDKTYNVQIDCQADDRLVERIRKGVTSEGQFLAVKGVAILRHGTHNSWLEIVLDEGRNRHIRRLLAALGVNVLRLVRIAIGPLALGNLAKGEVRRLTDKQVTMLASSSRGLLRKNQ